MGLQVVAGATLQCSFGACPGSLTVLPKNKVNATTPAANIMDNKPGVNIMPFGMCSSPANPEVASATAAASGVLTPMPCTPVTNSPWAPGATKTMIGKAPAVDTNCKLMCNWGGVIQVVNPGQTKMNTA